MVSQSISQQLERSRIAVRFDLGADAALVGQERSLANSLANTVPGDAPVRPDVGELHLVSIAHHLMTQLAGASPESTTDAMKDRRVGFRISRRHFHCSRNCAASRLLF